MKLLFAPDSAPGSGAPDSPAPPANTPAPPPAATAVLESGAREGDLAELVRLKREKEELERKLKEREVESAHLMDENHRLKAPPESKVQGPRSKAERAPGWLDAYKSDDEIAAE